MTIPILERDRLVTGWLAQAVPDCRQIGCGRWELGMKNDGGIAAVASIEDDWLLLRMPLQNARAGADEWRLLSRNATLEGLCKFVQDRGRCSPRLHADLPLDSEDRFSTLPRRILEALKGFEFALGGQRSSPEAVDPGSAPRSGGMLPEPGHAAGLASLIKDAGWPFVERSPVKFAVDLEVRGSFAQAAIEDQDGRGILAYMEAAKFDSLSDGQRAALGLFLLTACGVVRMARASIVESEASTVARFEVRFADPSPAELGHALAALSVAANLCGREAQCFEDKQVAEIYLMANGRTRSEKFF